MLPGPYRYRSKRPPPMDWPVTLFWAVAAIVVLGSYALLLRVIVEAIS